MTKPYTYMYRMWKNVFTTLEDNRYLLETHKYIYISVICIYIYIKCMYYMWRNILSLNVTPIDFHLVGDKLTVEAL